MRPQRKIILKNYQSPGDIVMLTAALRDLHKSGAAQFLTDVRTSCPQLWENNPYLTSLDETDPRVEVVNCNYPLVHQSNELPYHFIHGFHQNLTDQLGIQVKPTAFKGDIHLSTSEIEAPSPVHELLKQDIPYWIIVAGGKFDFTIKWWSPDRYQAVVNALKHKVYFVQVGEAGHCHPQLEGVLDLRGKTTLRQLIRLVYRSSGVLCPVTFAMHLAAAVPTPKDFPSSRPCVVVAGGREPAHWEAYPFHQFLHTIGALPCCSNGGCWRSRTRALGDGDTKDLPENLCVNVAAGGLPRCMDMITVSKVVNAIDLYLDGGMNRSLLFKNFYEQNGQ